MKSIRLKMVIMYLILVFIVMIACGTFTIVSLRTGEDRKAERRLTDAAELVKGAVIDLYDEAFFQPELTTLTRPAASVDQIEYNILDANARIIATNVTDNPLNVPQYKSSVIISAQSGLSDFASGRWYTSYQGLTRQWIEYARPVFTPEGVTYIIYLRIDATSIYESIYSITQIFILGLLIALALAVVLGIIFADSVNKPIRMLTKKAREFAQGKLDQDIHVFSRDEIGQLTESFNNMASQLNQNIVGLERERSKMETVLHNVTDGVLAYDMSGRLIHGNHVCRELLKLNNDEINALSLDEMLARLGIGRPDAGTPEPIKDEMLNINERFINVGISYYKGGMEEQSGVIILLQDLTKHMLLDNMRKEFVANVSHELRTPLTTIKSYTETLLEEMPVDEVPGHGEFLKTIDGETDRMTLLVNDLLELSRLDNKQLDFNFQTVDLAELISQNVKKHQHALAKKGSGKLIRFDPPGVSMPIKADHERINQVINNIITNSLRYSDEEAVVEVSVEDADNRYVARIKDNGMGIPPEDLERIFERFYRVDKARSRELGGTGLGLSISKEIVEAHGGELVAESTLGVGTIMTVWLQKITPTH